MDSIDTGKQLIDILFNGWLLTFALLCLAAIAYLRELRRWIFANENAKGLYKTYNAADARYIKARDERDSVIKERDNLANDQMGWIKAFEAAIKERDELKGELHILRHPVYRTCATNRAKRKLEGPKK
jgi:hypothetical protein